MALTLGQEVDVMVYGVSIDAKGASFPSVSHHIRKWNYQALNLPGGGVAEL